MKRTFIFATLLLCIISCLAGCVGITIDEARVFQPQPVANKATSVEDMFIEWEDVFDRPSTFTVTNNINNDYSTIQISPDDFIPAQLEHGFWADGTIAVTEFTVENDVDSFYQRPLVLHCGGNASDRYNSGTLFGLKVIPYADLIIFDYPGYGDSPGTPSAQSFEVMIDNLTQELNERREQSDRPLILWGYSLGGFVCAELVSAIKKVDGIIIESSADEARSAARQLVPALLRPFLRIRLSPTLSAYDNVDALMAYRGEVLVLAGAEDGILPAKLSRKLAEDLRGKGVSITYHEFKNGNHANLPTLDAYSGVLNAYFNQWKDSKPR